MSVSVPPARRVLLEGASPEEEEAFFSSLLLPGGAYKTTFAGRFWDLDARVAELLVGKQRIRLLDVGVSSGVTTVELIEALEGKGVVCSAVAADLVVQARLARASLLGELLVDGRGRFLQCAGGLGVRMRPYPRGARMAAARMLDAVARSVSRQGSRGEPVQLVTSRLAGRAGCEVVEHDVFADRPEWHRRFDVVRAANLLNLSYFPPDDIRHALRLLGGYLAPGGLLALCRTDVATRRNDATILRGGEGGFEVAVRLGEGSEVEELALG